MGVVDLSIQVVAGVIGDYNRYAKWLGIGVRPGDSWLSGGSHG